ncbi:MAG: hypothetical protein KDA17_03810 [Candidatus Saccharibacteria bacterium]|nr:hypothetical protein [Candidatus Saccharibacteria bacterium]
MFPSSIDRSDPRAQFRLYSAISRIKDHPDFQVLLDEFKAELHEQDRKNRIAQSPALEWGQGVAQFLNDLLETVEKSSGLREEYRKQVEQ